MSHPDRIGPYPIVRKLAEGGFGEVFLARQPALRNREVCIKRARRELADGSDPTFIERFITEIEQLARLSHPNIVSIIDSGQEEGSGSPYFVMEYVRGIDASKIAQRHRRKGVDARHVAHIIVGVAQALSYAHHEAVIHRDVKPHNVLISQRGHVKLTDFGIAKLQREGQYAVTNTSTFVGTCAYMAPELLGFFDLEQPGGERGPMAIDHRVDLWALGVMAFELLCGFRPFEDESVTPVGQRDRAFWLMSNVRNYRRRRVDSIRPEAPRAMLALIEDLLQPPELRVTTADEVVTRLIEAGLGLPTHRARFVEALLKEAPAAPPTPAAQLPLRTERLPSEPAPARPKRSAPPGRTPPPDRPPPHSPWPPRVAPPSAGPSGRRPPGHPADSAAHWRADTPRADAFRAHELHAGSQRTPTLSPEPARPWLTAKSTFVVALLLSITLGGGAAFWTRSGADAPAAEPPGPTSAAAPSAPDGPGAARPATTPAAGPGSAAGRAAAPDRSGTESPADAPPRPPGNTAAHAAQTPTPAQAARPEASPAAVRPAPGRPAAVSPAPGSPTHQAQLDAKPTGPAPDGGQAAAAEARAPCRVFIAIAPEGTILVDGKPRGRAPKTLTLSPGVHTITGRRRGARSSRTLRCQDGERHRMTIQLF